MEVKLNVGLGVYDLGVGLEAHGLPRHSAERDGGLLERVRATNGIGTLGQAQQAAALERLKSGGKQPMPFMAGREITRH